MDKSVTIRQIALRARCSHTTVSMALRNHPRVAAETRALVQKLAEEMGYCKDPVVSTLMGRLRTSRKRRQLETLGVINCWDTREGDRATILGQEQHTGIVERAASLGYNLDFLWARERGMTAKRLTRILQARGIRGVIMLSMPHARGHIPLDWGRLAAATIGYTLFKPELHRTAYSFYYAMVLMLRTLHQRGYQRIGFTNLINQEDMALNERLSAFLGYHFRKGGPPPITPLLLPEWDPQRVVDWVKTERPQVVVSSNSNPCRILMENGFNVPGEIGFASLDAIPAHFPCTGIRQPRNELGAKAVDLLAQQLENHEFGIPAVPKVVTLKGFWEEGPTLGTKTGSLKQGRTL